MAVIWKLRCPDCSGTFKWPGDQKLPDFCPLCQAPQNVPDDDEICMPFIRSAATGATDKVYRDMERGSEVRAQAASDILGVPTADVADLKITNLRDTHYGEASQVPVNNEVSRLMDKAPDATGFQAMGAQLSSGTQAGPYANRGAKFQTEIRKFHAGMAGWGAMSDNPSNEVMNPNYRRRA